MCDPFSCVVLPDFSVITGRSYARHSHSEMWRDSGRADEISDNQGAKVEITPPNNQWLSDVSTWTLKLDQDRGPTWWRDNLPEIDGRVREAAEKWQRRMHNLTEWDEAVDGDYLILAAPIHTRIGTVRGGGVLSYGSSTQEIGKVSRGEMRSYGSSKQTVGLVSSGDVWSHEASMQTIGIVSGGYVRSFGFSEQTIGIVSGGGVWSHGSSKQQIGMVSGGDVGSHLLSKQTVSVDLRKSSRC